MTRSALCCTLVIGALLGRQGQVRAAFQTNVPSTSSFQRPQRSVLPIRPQSSLELWPAGRKKSHRVTQTPSLQNDNGTTSGETTTQDNRRKRIRKRVADLALKFVVKPMSTAAPMPQGVAAVLREATMSAIDLAADEFSIRRVNDESKLNAFSNTDSSIEELMEEAFSPVEEALADMERALEEAKASLTLAKAYARDSLEAVQIAAMAQAEGTQAAVEAAKDEASRQAIVDIFKDVNVTDLTFEDVDYGTSEMAPPFLDEDSCLVPGEPVVRVEKAPENSRRIFAGIDIMASVDDVWKVLTDYERLQDCVPNLIVNEVVQTFDGIPVEKQTQDDTSLGTEQAQCKSMAEQMKGAVLRQVGGAKVVGINFSARTTLEVREWPQGLPDYAHFSDEIYEGKSRRQRAKDYTGLKLERYKFPRPFAVSSLPTKDISMQNIVDDDGEFRMYQGVWRMQPLPGCAPAGKQAMRLTYAVEVSPRAYLPVQLVERRIAKDLCTNLEAIRDFVAQDVAPMR